MRAAPVSDDDYAPTRAAATAMDRPPLVVLEPLTAFLDAHGLGRGPLTCRTIVGGNSNFVCELRRDGLHAVLRRPPRPPLPPRAHDMLREARVLQALAGHARVPRVLAVGTDPGVIGMPFYVMEHLDGSVLADRTPPAFGLPADRATIGPALVQALAEIHAVEPVAAGLGDLARPGRYLERQLRGFSSIWEHNRTRDVPAVERIAARLTRTLPAEQPDAIVHGDYRLGNAMLAHEPPARVVAIFDWELSALGDPLSDLGYLAATWIEPNDPPLAIFGRSDVMRAPGFGTRDALVARYEALTGRAVGEQIAWYRALALWKTAVFMEGNYRRARDGMADDPFLLAAADGVPQLTEYVEDVVLADLPLSA